MLLLAFYYSVLSSVHTELPDPNIFSNFANILVSIWLVNRIRAMQPFLSLKSRKCFMSIISSIEHIIAECFITTPTHLQMPINFWKNIQMLSMILCRLKSIKQDFRKKHFNLKLNLQSNLQKIDSLCQPISFITKHTRKCINVQLFLFILLNPIDL